MIQQNKTGKNEYYREGSWIKFGGSVEGVRGARRKGEVPLGGALS
jgi:hypothetical protein